MLCHTRTGRSTPPLVLAILAAAAAGCGRIDFGRQDAGATMDAGLGLDSGADGGVAPPLDAPAASDAGTDAGGEPACPAAACSSGCSLDNRAGSWSCTGGALTLRAPGPGALVDIDMNGHTRLDLTVVTCDPTGFVWHLGDSPSCNGYGGDGSEFGHDAELYQLETTLEAFAAQDVSPGVRLFSDPAFAAATGCTLATVSVYDARVVAPSIALDRSDPALLVINPATDSEGVPDARWFLATDRTYGDATRSGTGLRCMTVCIP